MQGACSVPPACRGNLKEGVLICSCVYELWFGDWYYSLSSALRTRRTQGIGARDAPFLPNAEAGASALQKGLDVSLSAYS
jgi:hypothetical protein